jgi:hypothetical protein
MVGDMASQGIAISAGWQKNYNPYQTLYSGAFGGVLNVAAGAAIRWPVKTASTPIKSRSFETGAEGEEYLRDITGGKKTWVRDIPIKINEARNRLPVREVDSLANFTAHESKVGFVNYSEKVAWQILKDRAIVRNNVNNITSAQWHFYRSSVTGEAGAAPKVLRLLERSGIPYTIDR